MKPHLAAGWIMAAYAIGNLAGQDGAPLARLDAAAPPELHRQAQADLDSVLAAGRRQDAILDELAAAMRAGIPDRPAADTRRDR